MKILGIDYGESRIGVAISDETGIMAQGLTTLKRKNRQADLQALGDVIEKQQIERIVLGYPLRIDGSAGIQCEKVSRFAALLERTFHLPVICWDETFSTKEAEEMMFQMKVKRGKKREMVDRIAASIILQDYLNAHAQAECIRPPSAD
jgi:putative holliday junction resolvase